MRTYPRLSIEEFGSHLITSEDLDPIYVALRELKLEPELLSAWLVAYWCFYSAGSACWLASSGHTDFWSRMHIAAANEQPNPFGQRWPRGQERRHFRGKASVGAVEKLREKYPKPYDMVVALTRREGGNDGPRMTCGEVMKRVQSHHLFGPWIGFKVADMIDRVIGIPIDFTSAEVFMFDQPRESALMLWRERALGAKAPGAARPRDEDKAIGQVVAYLTDVFRNQEAPPDYKRPIGLQEVETILCKWKSHMNGHYPLFNDIDEIREGLEPWTKDCELARKFLEVMPARTP